MICDNALYKTYKAYSEKMCPIATLSPTDATWMGLGWNMGFGILTAMPVSNHLSHGTVSPLNVSFIHDFFIFEVIFLRNILLLKIVDP
jgi:hypothetical protein